jgi:hypothetical protein
MYCFGIHQPLFNEMEKTIPNITFHQELPSPEVIDKFTADRRHRLIGPGKSCLPGVFNAMVLDFVPLGKMFCVMNTTLSLRW